MLSFVALLITASLCITSAHVSLQYPSPRGPQIASAELQPCDGYTSVGNRTIFPLQGGLVSISSEHKSWTLGVLISVKPDPYALTDFTNSSGQYQWVNDANGHTGEGIWCVGPFNVSGHHFAGVSDGANATLQIVYNGRDGVLYQCADITLSKSAEKPSFDDLGCIGGHP